MAETKLSRKEKVAILKKHQMKLFDAEGIDYDNVKYIPKMCYVPRGADEKVITFFKNELSGGEDIYTEFISRDVESEDPNRILYKWNWNPHFEDEYNVQSSEGGIDERYWIPISELVNITEKHSTKISTRDVSALSPQLYPSLSDKAAIDDILADCPINELTIRDKAAIAWKKPVSNKGWLNKLIKETFTP
jgi:hypothetical protein